MVKTFKEAIISTLGLSNDALHIYVGLGVLLIAAASLRKPLHSPVPWLLVFGVAMAGEMLDMVVDLLRPGGWQWQSSVHDVINTLFWPSVLVLLARYSALCRRTAASKT